MCDRLMVIMLYWRITDKVLAMARPSTMLIKEKNLIDEFKLWVFV